MNKGTSVLSLGVIWFGAAVSVAEIEAGIQSGNNWAALILGHILGGFMLFAVGLMGAGSQKNAMETTEESFGKKGSKFFASLNVLQLIGWTSVMIAQATAALAGLELPFPTPVVCGLLALLVALWIFIGLGNSNRFGTVAMATLALLVIVLSYKLFNYLGVHPEALSAGISATFAGGAPKASAPLSFWQSFELSIAMPLSWLPLISDYTKDAKAPLKATATAATVYTLTSIWMYAIGMGIGVAFANGIISEASLTGLISGLGIGLVGILIILFSTVTTTFLDAYSAGESARAIFGKVNSKIAGVITCAIGAILAITGIIDRYADFLYLIASVFAPMAAVLVVYHYLVQRDSKNGMGKVCLIHVWNIIAWLSGFIGYQLAGDSPIGPSLTAILVSATLTAAGLFFKKAN